MEQNTSIGRTVLEAFVHNVWFYLLAGISVALLVASFIMPPMGVIDSSVLAAVGELFAFASLGAALKAIDKRLNATVTKGDTKLSITQRDGQDEKDSD